MPLPAAHCRVQDPRTCRRGNTSPEPQRAFAGMNRGRLSRRGNIATRICGCQLRSPRESSAGFGENLGANHDAARAVLKLADRIPVIFEKQALIRIGLRGIGCSGLEVASAGCTCHVGGDRLIHKPNRTVTHQEVRTSGMGTSRCVLHAIGIECKWRRPGDRTRWVVCIDRRIGPEYWTPHFCN